MRLMIVSGLSGSGKSSALDTLADHGCYCVDNLPASLIEPFAHGLLHRAAVQDAPREAVIGIDARSFSAELPQVPQIVERLRALGMRVEVLFLLADDAILLRRYAETRRPHPLGRQADGLLSVAIEREQHLLSPIQAMADLIIDTSALRLAELRRTVCRRVLGQDDAQLSILIESFGFKHGTPRDADFQFDVRCLPNPYWEVELRDQTGLDEGVIHFLSSREEVQQMLDDIDAVMQRWIPRIAASERSYLTIAIGCTGGQHRSVYVATQLAERLCDCGLSPQLLHRELKLPLPETTTR